MDEKSIEELHRCKYPECMETVVEDEDKCSEHLSKIYDKQEPGEDGVEPEINSMPREVQDVAHFLHSHCGEKDLGLWLRVLREELDGLQEFEDSGKKHPSERLPIAKVTIMAGIPGSGKSYEARQRFPDWPGNILSTDDFWLNDDGKYEFDAKRITEAHGWNFQRFLVTLGACHSHRQQGRFQCPDIIIDNTNTTIAEIAPYYAAAQSFGADVQVLAVLCPWEVAAKRQQHGLPAAKVYQMHLRLQETLRSFPAWWSLDVVDNTPNPGWTPSF